MVTKHTVNSMKNQNLFNCTQALGGAMARSNGCCVVLLEKEELKLVYRSRRRTDETYI